MAAIMDEKPAAASLSETEKELGSMAPDKFAGFEDPDAGLSEEEKAKIVCTTQPTKQTSLQLIHSSPWVSSFCRSVQLLTTSWYVY
jgi:beta-phosphoglucomutase-like phosphatase (HAD superfamily)